MAKKARGFLVPLKALEVIENGIVCGFESGMRREAEAFCECAVSDTARNMIDLFLNARRAGSVDRIQGIAPQSVQIVGLLGGGVMGSGIANLLLRNGLDVLLWARTQESVQRTLENLRKSFSFQVQKGRLTETDVDMLLGERLVLSTDISALEHVDAIIESVVEDLAVKHDLLFRVAEVIKKEALLATNTSSLPITKLAGGLPEPGRVIGLHFFTPQWS